MADNFSDRSARTTRARPAGQGTEKTGMTWPPALPFPSVLARARSLDGHAISLLYRRFLPVIYRYILARVGDIHVAEDLTSDTFMAMVENIETTRAQDELGFAAWLLGIARNVVAQLYRKRATHTESMLAFAPDGEPQTFAEEGDPLAIITARESWSEAVQALNKLTEDQRNVVLYRCILGYSAEDVAQLMNKQAGTVRALQFRALAALTRHMRAYAPGEQPGVSRQGRRSR